jgi:hypothetical protein
LPRDDATEEKDAMRAMGQNGRSALARLERSVAASGLRPGRRSGD